MSKSTLIIFGVILLASLLFGLGLFFLPTSKKTATPAATVPGADLLAEKQITLPVTYKDPHVVAAQVAYTFKGNILDTAKEGENLRLVTDISLRNLPQIIVTPQTGIFYLKGTKSVRTTMDKLQPNQNIRIVAYYGINTTRWRIRNILILVDSLPASSPTKATTSPTSLPIPSPTKAQ